MARTEECILYRNFDNGEVLDIMTSLMNSYEAGEEGFENRKEEFFHMVPLPRSEGQWREALTIWLFMILEFSKNFMTLILLFLTVRLEQTVLIFSVIM